MAGWLAACLPGWLADWLPGWQHMLSAHTHTHTHTHTRSSKVCPMETSLPHSIHTCPALTLIHTCPALHQPTPPHLSGLCLWQALQVLSGPLGWRRPHGEAAKQHRAACRAEGGVEYLGGGGTGQRAGLREVLNTWGEGAQVGVPG